jgi:hypothetical protein
MADAERNCPHCLRAFVPKRADQVYCTSKHRQAFYAASLGDGALRGAVSRVSPLKRGKVSITLHFAPMDRDNALQIVPGTVVEVMRDKRSQ